MSSFIKKETGKNSKVIFNGCEFPGKMELNIPQKTEESFIVRYVGTLLQMQQGNSIEDIAKAVKELHHEGINITMELYGTETNPKMSQEICDNKIIRHFGKFNEEDYLNLLTSSSLLVIPFTFNNRRIENYRFSFPAKLPDSLACGVPVLIYGPPEMDAVQYCKNNHVGHIICEQSIHKLKEFMKKILENPKFFNEKAVLSQQHARLNMSVQGNYQIFRQFFVNISTK